jgi:hypothetical protein
MRTGRRAAISSRTISRTCSLCQEFRPSTLRTRSAISTTTRALDGRSGDPGRASPVADRFSHFHTLMFQRSH